MTTAIKSRAFLALGGNLGEPKQAFQIACDKLLRHPRIAISAASSLYRTPPVGGPPGQPDYLNAVVALTTDLTPQQLLEYCQTIENEAGRIRAVRWEARPLDLDLLLYDQLILDTASLQLPHPRLHERHFVLLPLTELAPDTQHPLLQQTFAELLATLPQAEGITRLADKWITL